MILTNNFEMGQHDRVIVERRKDARLELRVPVLLFGAESENPVRSETVNISKTGFYCSTKEPFAPGDRLRCLLSISAPCDSTESELYLDAEVEVIRVRVDTSGFGLGCRIGEYHIVSQQAIKLPIREFMHA
jgi:hypothetical protein